MEVMIVEKPGLFDTIQDDGRYGYQASGMVVAGAMDTYSYQLGNILLGNAPYAPSLEFTVLGPKVRFTQPTVIALTGADFHPIINGRPMPMWRAIEVEEGDTLDIGSTNKGCRGYLAIKGGFKVPPTLHSRSTYVKGNIGGWGGRTLEKGDYIPYEKIDQAPHTQFKSRLKFSIPFPYRPSFPREVTLKVIMGPQEEAFTQKGVHTFLNEAFEVSPQMDRMGIRLSGPHVRHKQSADILSDAIPLGAVQVPANGQPIILMADRQPTGGYTKIACLATVDIPKAAQLQPGQYVRFKSVTVQEAQRDFKIQEQYMRTLQLLIAQ
ncbi:biotin-dependent carboxyltransferase family protein [Caldalkalibacillus salinus]|uniref:5-oxoprolinase subunit C family protein n=1 Tax=Caldalkalibacillus salinus TaxID=2803787 RepID=UPI0019237355|nr:biotin-dependent carboxyltransferase family protein [Caldalkalibacillus salinus]